VKSSEPAVELFKSAWKILQNLRTMKNTLADVILDFEVLELLTQNPASKGCIYLCPGTISRCIVWLPSTHMLSPVQTREYPKQYDAASLSAIPFSVLELC
jgi:hypothetical protein